MCFQCEGTQTITRHGMTPAVSSWNGQSSRVPRQTKLRASVTLPQIAIERDGGQRFSSCAVSVPEGKTQVLTGHLPKGN